MDRTIRFAAADWRDGDKINKDKLATAIANVLAKTLAAKPAAAAWNANTGKLKLTFKRPSQIYPGARPHRERRDHRAGVAGQAGRVRPADAVDLKPRRSRRRTKAPGPKLNLSENPAATRKAASPGTTTARSTRWPGNSRASAGTPTNRPGNRSLLRRPHALRCTHLRSGSLHDKTPLAHAVQSPGYPIVVESAPVGIVLDLRAET